MLAPRVATEREGRFTPVLRSRVLERIARAARYPIAVIAAPAGYGKTVALRQYLDSINGPVVRYDLRASESTLLGFIRGFAHAFAEFAPDLAKTVISAYESNHSSPTCAADLAQWMHAHIKDFDGLVAIDDLHVAQDEPRVDEFLSRLIDLTKQKTSWLLASRGVGALPVASWIAYGDMEFVIDERDLRMTLDEAQSVAHELAPGVDEAELKALLGATDAWPTALSFALRSSTNVGDLREAAATSRDLLYRYLAEQVYRSLEPRHIELLHFIAQLQEIDVEVLRCAGFERPEASLEELQSRIGFIYRERMGLYRCHDLFREFLRHAIQLGECEGERKLQCRAAAALEDAGHIPNALDLYARSGSEGPVLRLLRLHGFSLLDHAHSDTIRRALESLTPHTRKSDPIVLGFLGLTELHAGHYKRAEFLLRRAMAQSVDQQVSAQFAVRLGSLLFNQRADITALLEPIAFDDSLDPDTRMSALGFLAAAYASNGRRHESLEAIGRLENYSHECTSTASRSRCLHRAGVAALHLGLEQEKVMQYFTEAAEVASRHGHYFTANAALGGASSTVMFHTHDIRRSLRYAEGALRAARRAGDRFSLQLALLHLVHIESWGGRIDRVRDLENQFLSVTTIDSSLRNYVAPATAMLAAWRGDFESADACLMAADHCPVFDFDRAYDCALHAIYAISCGRRERAIALVDRAINYIAKVRDTRTYPQLVVELSRTLAVITEALAGRMIAARRHLRRRAILQNPAVTAAWRCAEAVCTYAEEPSLNAHLTPSLAELQDAGCGGLAMIIDRATSVVLGERRFEPALTAAETEVLTSLANGRTPKEIALETGRSVHTVRTLSQRAIQKLGCRGRQEAIIMAQREGLIASFGRPVGLLSNKAAPWKDGHSETLKD
jgi:ATP/maltotriose-dependent transcriptional regulator MalT